jgi:hypothetical protein
LGRSASLRIRGTRHRFRGQLRESTRAADSAPWGARGRPRFLPVTLTYLSFERLGPIAYSGLSGNRPSRGAPTHEAPSLWVPRGPEGRNDMRTIVLGAMAVLTIGLTGMLGASGSATPIKAAPIDEAAGAVSLMTKAYSCKTIGGCHHRYRHHHTATSTSPRQSGGKAQQQPISPTQGPYGTSTPSSGPYGTSTPSSGGQRTW